MIIHLTNSYNIVKIDHKDKRLSLMEIPGAPYPILLPDNYFILYPGFEQYGMEFTNTFLSLLEDLSAAFIILFFSDIFLFFYIFFQQYPAR